MKLTQDLLDLFDVIENDEMRILAFIAVCSACATFIDIQGSINESDFRKILALAIDQAEEEYGTR